MVNSAGLTFFCLFFLDSKEPINEINDSSSKYSLYIPKMLILNSLAEKQMVRLKKSEKILDDLISKC